MAIVAPVVDGKIQSTSAEKNTASATEKDKSSMGKDAFLQLLVAQMKYQDPLEPTSNTEYISQLATFSELEQMQNMSSSIDLQRASALVGKEVYMKTTSENGNFVHGKVDYVVMESGKAYLSIEEQLYPLEDLDTIVDEDYTEAVNLATDFTKKMNQLPKYEYLTLDYAEDILALKETYDKMSKYQQSFVTTDNQKKLEKFADRITELQKATEEKAKRLAEQFKKDCDALPKLEELTIDNKDAVAELAKTYGKMSKYQKTFVGDEYKEKLEKYVSRMEELEKEQV